MHAGVVAGDAARALAAGRVGRAMSLLFRRSVLISLARYCRATLAHRTAAWQGSAGRLFRPSAKGRATPWPACLILVLDERGLVPVFGVPAVRRLVLLARKSDWNRSASSAAWSLFGPRSPISFSPSFQTVEDPRALEQAVRGACVARRREGPGDEGESRDRPIPFRSGGDPFRAGALLPGRGRGGDGDSLYLSDAEELLPLLSALCFDPLSAPSVLSGAERLEGVPGLPCAVGAGRKGGKDV